MPMRATREGRRFILASVLIAAAALNTGNNLIYLILALMLSLVLLSLVILKVTLSGLSLGAASVSPIFAGEEASFSLTVSNRKRHIHSYSVSVLSESMTSLAYFPVVPAQGRTTKEVKIVFKRRGLYGRRNFTARSGFPFILFVGEREMEVRGAVLVYPALRDVGNIASDGWGTEEGDAVRSAGAGEEIHSIREFRQGDDLRRIHWKASAKVADLMVKEYAEHELRRTTIIIDNLRRGVLLENKADREVFEKAVSLAASLARHFIDRGNLVRIVSAKKVVPFGSGNEQLFKILDILAVIAEEDRWESPLPEEGEGFILSVFSSSGPSSGSLSAISDQMVHAETL
jgi:uncharacterized protein (DUF58 family)